MQKPEEVVKNLSQGKNVIEMLKDQGQTDQMFSKCAISLGLNEENKEMYEKTVSSMGNDSDICSIVAGALFSGYLASTNSICNMYENEFPMNLVDGSMASFIASKISEDRGSDRVIDLLSVSPLKDSDVPEYVQYLVYGFVSGVMGYVTGFTDD